MNKFIIFLITISLVDLICGIYGSSVNKNKEVPWYLSGIELEPPDEYFSQYESKGVKNSHQNSNYFNGKSIHGQNIIKNKGKHHKIINQENLYEGAIDEYNKPTKEKLFKPKKLSIKLTIAKETDNGVECPYPQATGQFIYPLDCQFFVNCWNGRAYVQPCPPGTNFNPQTLECDFPYKVKCYSGELADYIVSDDSDSIQDSLLSTTSSYKNGVNCLEIVNGFLPHPDYCQKFLQCVDGETIVQDCDHGRVFNPSLGVCDSSENVEGCEDISFRRHSKSSKYKLRNSNLEKSNVDNTPGCPPDYSGLIPYPNQCTKFLHCDHGIAFIKDCGPGTVFNPDFSVCDWPRNVPGCENVMTQTVEVITSDSNNENEEEIHDFHNHENIHDGQNEYDYRRKLGHRSNSKPAACPEGFSGFLPHPESCNRFLHCDRGFTVISDCSPGTVYNPNTMVCDWPFNVPGCNSGPIKQPSYSNGYNDDYDDKGEWNLGEAYYHRRDHRYNKGQESKQSGHWSRPYYSNPSWNNKQNHRYNAGANYPHNSQYPNNRKSYTTSDSNIDDDVKGRVYGDNESKETLWVPTINSYDHRDARRYNILGLNQKVGSSGINVNRNGLKGHYIVKESDVNQDSNGYNTPSSKFKTTTDTSTFNTFNTQGFNNWKPINNNNKFQHTSTYFNSTQPTWKPVKFNNKTQNNHFNQFHEFQWKPLNQTATTSTIFHSHTTTLKQNIDSYIPSETTTPKLFTQFDKEVQVDTPWQKPDTNVPSVSIDSNYSDTNPHQIGEITVEADPTNYDFEILLNTNSTWKPKISFETTTKSHDYNSVIMKIHNKKNITSHENFNSQFEDEPPFPTYYIPPVQSLSYSYSPDVLAPHSGQIIRLRGGSSVRSGYLEVQGIQPGWGIICDSENSWTLKEADVVCRQLGYTRGAEATWQGGLTAEKNPWIAGTKVTCHGNETNFQSCQFVHESNCNIKRDAVGLSCMPNYLAYCQPGEVAYQGNCYHLINSSKVLTHTEALDYCKEKNSKLIDIRNQAENNFVTDWLMVEHPDVKSIMTSGIGFKLHHKTIWMWDSFGDKNFRFSNWWPGWKEEIDSPPKAQTGPLCVVIKKTFPCYNKIDSNCPSDYFFWDVQDCSNADSQHSYVCKRPYNDISCIYGKGHQYSGVANITLSGKPCLPWSHKSIAYFLHLKVKDYAVRRKLKEHNYCRNPNPSEELKPWCFVESTGEIEYCDIPRCGNIERSPMGGCKKGLFECMPGDCIPSHWKCDGQEDCINGRDEEFCSQHLNFFRRIPSNRLDGYDVEKWIKTPLETCALRCKEADFTCRSFSFQLGENLCLLSDKNVGMTGGLKSTPEFDYYEMIDLTMDCAGMFICKNRKCINQTQVCNGKNDCNDRSDEDICTVENLGYEIRLAGSNKSNEGRVEVKILDTWGQVCDDGFGMENADVICRELGFDLGALKIEPTSFFGNINPPTRFMVDQLKCQGNETSLRECEFDGWGVHNCSPEEAVGIVCKTPNDICEAGMWKCDNSKKCISPSYICDMVVDCPDSSDESSSHCDSPFQMRLVNGSIPGEGRLEIRHHGVWGTVCDDDFSHVNAKVVCRALGFSGEAIAKKNGFFGQGTGPIWLDDVVCRGNEKKLYHCEHELWGRNNCNHNEDVGVVCDENSKNFNKSDSEYSSYAINTILPNECGKRAKDFPTDFTMFERIVKGSIAPKESYPWQASIRVRGHSVSNHWCGAVIISPLHVLTAAHCLKGYSKGSYFIRAGDYNTKEVEGTEVDANIENYYIHEDFRKGPQMNNDIALVLLKGQGIPLGKHIMPICLPSPDTEYTPGLNCTISGFGSVENGKITHSIDLRYGWIPLIEQSVCKASQIYGSGNITDGMVCAGYLNEDVDACHGDSGGPLACLQNGEFTLFGITSWGMHCGEANKPGVYVRVAHYRDWIDKKIKDTLSGR